MSPFDRWFRRSIILILSLALVLVTWSVSARVPLRQIANQSFVPVTFSADSQLLACGTPDPNPLMFQANGPIHLLRTADLTPVGPAVALPAALGGVPTPLPILAVEFSPKQDLVAVAQLHRDPHEIEKLELHLLRVPGGEVTKSFAIPYDRWNRHLGIAARLFSDDGRLLAWHESPTAKAASAVRVWDLVADRERFHAAGVAYPVMSPDGSVLAAVKLHQQELGACHLFDTATGKTFHTLPLEGNDRGWVPWPTFSPDGRFVAVNANSSTGKGPSVSVFDVATGQRVLQVAEWSPHFLADSTLVTVKNESVVFRSPGDWQVRAQAAFELGVHWDNGAPIYPEPLPVPKRNAVLVYHYYPGGDHWLTALGRKLNLNLGRGHRASWVDAATGHVTPFTASTGLLERTVTSPDGTLLAIHGTSGLSLWQLPPPRSYWPAIAVAGCLLILFAGRRLGRRLQNQSPPRSDQSSE